MKKTIVVLLALFAFTRLSAQPNGDGTASTQAYKPGDVGPAGGIVFYDRGFTDGGWRYLEAAPAGTEFTAQWGISVNVAGTDTKVGSGKQNTMHIIAVLGENGKAAQLCANLNLNGYNDWFLPSRDELDLMHNSLRQRGLGSFLSGVYWSSSYYGSYSNRVWAQRFSDGSQYLTNDDGNPIFVRAIRAF